MSQRFTCFEHGRLRLGDRALDGSPLDRAGLEDLQRFHARTQGRYTALDLDGLRFNQHVGLILGRQVSVEVLPKTADAAEDPTAWRGVLLGMLARTHGVSVERTELALLARRQGSLLDFVVRAFLQRAERLLREGLRRGYRPVEENLSRPRGKLLLGPHLRQNHVQRQRMYTRRFLYDCDTPENRILCAALERLRRVPLSPHTAPLAQRIRAWFPALPPPKPGTSQRRLSLGRDARRYQEALALAWLILDALVPDLRSHTRPLLAFLFDMNRLFERYVAQLAARLRVPGVAVTAQESTPYFRLGGGSARTLQPDLVLRAGERTVVVDTKWKRPKQAGPAREDLWQMFLYNEHFDAAHAVLLYPGARGPRRGRFLAREHSLELAGLPLLHGGAFSERDSAAHLRALIERWTAPPDTAPRQGGARRRDGHLGG